MRQHARHISPALVVGRVVLGVVSLVAIGAWLFIAISRMRYPYELEWLESGVLEHVRRLADHQPLYTPPSVDFVQFAYTPIFFVVGRVFAAVFGLSFSTLRLVAILATLATFWLIFRIVRDETKQRWAALVAVGVYAAAYRHVGAWFDIGKADSLFLALTLGAVVLVRESKSVARTALAGVVLAIAILTKQTAMFVAAPVIAYLTITRWRHAVAFASTTVGVTALMSLWINHTSNGWFNYYVWEQLFQHGEAPGSKLTFLKPDMILYWPLVIIFFAVGREWFAKERRWAMGFYGSAIVGFLGGSWASRLHSGGYDNVLMPASAAMALVLGVSLGLLSKRATPHTWKSGAIGLATIVLCATQFYFLRYDVSDQIPTRADERAGNELIAWLETVPGDVLITSHPTYAVMAGKQSHASQGSVIDILRAKDERPKQILRASYADAIHQQRFAAIVLDGDLDDDVFPSDWQLFYERSPQKLFKEEGTLLPVTSPTGRPAEVWVPRQNG